MANEYLQRTPTSTGNRKVFTISFWAKISSTINGNAICDSYGNGTNFLTIRLADSTFGNNSSVGVYQIDSAVDYSRSWNISFRDFSAWSHHLFVFNSPSVDVGDRLSYYLNGVKIINYSDTYGTFPQNFDFKIDTTRSFQIFRNGDQNTYGKGELCDYFFIDGQALTPDVFGFYKQGKGYISVGSTQATDFRPGQWVPKTPRVIKSEIIRRGGFGVNGFYLPMNDSKNFGADFHCDPNSIITLNEKLPQPRVGVASTAVGIGYTDALRADPYAANLVLALPFVSGGLSSGFGDYAPSIKGSGSAKTVTANGSVSIASTAGYYGSAASFNGADATNISLGTNSDYNFGTGDWTVELWFNTNITGRQRLVSTTQGGFGSNTWVLRLEPSNNLTFFSNNTISGAVASARQWNHAAVVRKGTNTSLFLNGVCCGIDTSDTKNYSEGGTNGLWIGTYYNTGSGGEAYNGYIQDLRVYKGVAKYTGGFDVPKPYTPVGIATWRAVPDSPANNFCTWNPLSAFDGAQSNGNLTSTTNDLMGTVGVSTGKWYWEIYDTTAVGGGGNVMHHGVSFTNFNQAVNGRFDSAPDGKLTIRLDAVNQSTSGTSITITSQIGTVPTYSNGDIYAIALDLDNGQVRHYRNGSVILTTNFTYNRNTQAIPYTRNNGLSCSANFGQNPTFSGNVSVAGTFADSNGKGLFKYQPPSGFLALCEDNLPTPAISDPGKHFRVVIYPGSSTTSFKELGFKPDFVWFKQRGNSVAHYLYDSIRGTNNWLQSSSTNQETYTSTGGVGSFAETGIGLAADQFGDTNYTGRDYVAWCWRAGAGTTSTNTNGSITSVVSVNQDAGFSIVSYTGNGVSNATVGHGLGRTPAMVIIKCRNEVRSWIVFHRGASPAPNPLSSTTFALGSLSSGCLSLNLTTGTFAYTMDGQTNVNGNTYVAYCWAEIEGFSKFGSYVGNGNADGPFVYCGFKPAWLLVKNASTAGNNWVIIDSSRESTNPTFRRLQPNVSDVEVSDTTTIAKFDLLSNGFKSVGGDGSLVNTSGNTYIFAAFAESPFTTANAK